MPPVVKLSGEPDLVLLHEFPGSSHDGEVLGCCPTHQPFAEEGFLETDFLIQASAVYIGRYSGYQKSASGSTRRRLSGLKLQLFQTGQPIVLRGYMYYLTSYPQISFRISTVSALAGLSCTPSLERDGGASFVGAIQQARPKADPE